MFNRETGYTSGMSEKERRAKPRLPAGLARRIILPVLAVLVLAFEFLFGSGGCVEIRPGEVGVAYNNTGIPLFGDRARTIVDQGIQTFIPGLQSIEKLERRPQILLMADEQALARKKGSDYAGLSFSSEQEVTNRVRALTVRAIDGSNFYFDVLELHYQVIPKQADKVIDTLGPGDNFKRELLPIYTRGILRDEFGRYSFLEIANPTTYGTATNDARKRMNEELEMFGVEVIQIITPKPKFDARVEVAIEERQNAEQEIEVQAEKRRKLEQESGLKVQSVEQDKNAEYQTLLAELEAKKKEAENKLIAAKREADKYFIERQSTGQAYRDEKVTRARANEVAYRKQGEALAARIQAVGAQGTEVLNRVIAEKVFPQLNRIKATPLMTPAAPFDIRYLNPPKKSGGGE